MNNEWISEIDISTLIAVCSVLLVFSVQLLLCFKSGKIFLRLLPPLVLTAATVFLFIMNGLTTDWDAIGYAIIAVFSGVLLLFSGAAWGVWGICKAISRDR